MRWHYDVTEGKRRQALGMGAQETGYRGLARLMAARREGERRRRAGRPAQVPRRVLPVLP